MGGKGRREKKRRERYMNKINKGGEDVNRKTARKGDRKERINDRRKEDGKGKKEGERKKTTRNKGKDRWIK